MMNTSIAGIVAGLIATAVLSALMLYVIFGAVLGFGFAKLTDGGTAA